MFLCSCTNSCLSEKSVFRRAGKYAPVYELYNVRKRHVDTRTARLRYVVGLELYTYPHFTIMESNTQLGMEKVAPHRHNAKVCVSLLLGCDMIRSPVPTSTLHVLSNLSLTFSLIYYLNWCECTAGRAACSSEMKRLASQAYELNGN